MKGLVWSFFNAVQYSVRQCTERNSFCRRKAVTIHTKASMTALKFKQCLTTSIYLYYIIWMLQSAWEFCEWSSRIKKKIFICVYNSWSIKYLITVLSINLFALHQVSIDIVDWKKLLQFSTVLDFLLQTISFPDTVASPFLSKVWAGQRHIHTRERVSFGISILTPSSAI